MILRKLSAAEQAATYLRKWLIKEQISGQIPGVDRLAVELVVSRDTIRSALKLLEAEGLIRKVGNGRSRMLVRNPGGESERRKLRVVIFPDMRMEHYASYLISYILSLQRQITDAGYSCVIADRTLADLENDLPRMARYVAKHEADLWIVMSAASEVLEWFQQQKLTVIAWGGRHRHLTIPGSGSSFIPALREAVQHLLSLGHRRIVFLSAPLFRQPSVSPSGQVFLDELAAGGVVTSQSYHLPDFPSTSEGIHAMLAEIFRVTPPTALIVGLHAYHLAVNSFLLQKRLRVPEDVSTVVAYIDSKLEWLQPPQAHFQVQMDKIVRRIMLWVDEVAQGKRPEGCVVYDATYVPAESVARISPG